MKYFCTLFAITCFVSIGHSQFDPEIDIDITNFENYYDYSISIDTSSQNLWQVGTPGKSFFDSAFSPSLAILTDTINSYSSNNASFFDLKFYPNNPSYSSPFYGGNVFFEIKHKFDTDTLLDGGYISISYDNGQSFTNILKDSLVCMYFTPRNNIWTGGYYNDSLYTLSDTLYNGENGFSGHSNNWITTRFAWYDIPIKCQWLMDTTIIRFNFISDSIQTNKEGWMIDNIRLYTVEFPGNIDKKQNSNIRVYPNPANDVLSIDLGKIHQEIQFQIFSIEGKLLATKKYFHSKSFIFKTGELTSGAYLIKVISKNNLLGVKHILID